MMATEAIKIREIKNSAKRKNSRLPSHSGFKSFSKHSDVKVLRGYPKLVIKTKDVNPSDGSSRFR